MIKEQKLKFIENNNDILQKIKLNGKYLEQNDNIDIEYYGDKNLLEIELNDENKKNNYLVGKYKNKYIGCLSISNPNSREKFGLNKYFNDTFYLGQWKDNLKEGIGFLKVKDDISYLGQFSKNQINGFGILNLKINNCFYLGNFINGEMDSGIYYNNKTTVFYNGKILEGKKNDELCSYFDFKNNHIFIGEVKNNIFVKGYLAICKITENNKEKEEAQTNISIEKVIYFDKTNTNNARYEYFYNFNKYFYDKIQDIFFNVFGGYFDLKNIHDNYYLAFFKNLENTVYNDSYNEYLERYNPEEKFNLENNFIKNYELYHKRFLQLEKKLNLKSYENIINSAPIIQNELKIDIK
jgi:hypothetical protein